VTIAPSDVSSVPVLPASAVTAISAAQMAEVDRAAIEDFGVTILQMMEQAGSHLAEVVRLELGGSLDERRVVVAVGPGNNGGGGLVAARHLANRGATVRVVLSRPALRMSEPSRHQLATLIAMGAECCVATYDLDDDELVDVLSSADAIVDAILGYNIDAAPRGEEARLIDLVAGAGRPVISLDLPSGIHPDTGVATGSAIAAAATMTLALPKVGLSVAEGPARTGRLYLADLGLPEALYTALHIRTDRPFVGGRIVLLDRSA
jgi:NAD(P)H-hydrate epimerase